MPAPQRVIEALICNAHSENESLCLEDLSRALRATAHLFSELAHYAPSPRSVRRDIEQPFEG